MKKKENDAPPNGEYGYHDWKADQEGDQILTLSPRFGPAVQAGLRDRRERVQRIAPQPEEGRLTTSSVTKN